MNFILKNQRSLFWVLVAFCLGMLLLRNYQYVSIARDVYWHVKMGLDLLDKGLSPFIDHYSVEYFGNAFDQSPPIPFQVFLAFMYKLVSNEGFISFTLTVVFYTTILVFIFLAQKLKFDLWYTSLGVLIISNALILRPLLRPEIISYIFELVAVLLALRALEHWTRKKAVALALLLVLWANYHASVVFGFTVVGAVYIELILKALFKKDFARLTQRAIWGLFTFCMGFLVVGHLHPIIMGLYFDKRWLNYILEYKKILEGFTVGYFLQIFMLVGLLLHMRTRKIAFFVITLVLFYNTQRINKLFPHTFVICTPLFLISLREFLRTLPKPFENKMTYYKAIIFVCLLLVFFKSLYSARIWENYRKDHWKSTPVHAADYFEKENIKSNLLSSMEGGGYFIYRNSPNIKVAIDGRSNILYDIRFFEKINFSAKRVSYFIQLWKEDKYQYISSNYLKSPFVMETAWRVGGYDLILEDGYYFLFHKAKNRFPLFRQVLLYPGCIMQMKADALSAELELFKKSAVNSESLFEKIVPVVIGYIKAENKAQFIGSMPLKLSDLDLFQFRIFTQMFMMSGLKSRAFLLYNFYPNEVFLERDKLAFALLLTELIEEQNSSGEDLQEKLKFLLAKIRDIYTYEVKNLTPVDKGVFLEIIDRYEKLSGEKVDFFKINMDKLATRYKDEFEAAKNIKAKDIFSRNCDTETELRFRSY